MLLDYDTVLHESASTVQVYIRTSFFKLGKPRRTDPTENKF